MRFKTDLKNIRTFSKLTAALSSVEKIAWARLDDDTARFTVIPDKGSQVWASLSMDLIFHNYILQSAEPNNTINLELPLQALQRALKSALHSTSASLRLTKKNGIPLLSMTITTTTGGNSTAGRARPAVSARDPDPFTPDDHLDESHVETALRRDHEKVITQDIPVRVLHPDTVETIMQPRVRDTDVHIQFPPLLQLKAISDRFTKLVAAGSSGSGSAAPASTAEPAAPGARLELSANMHGSLRLRVATASGDVASEWAGLENPELDPAQMGNGALEQHPSTRFREAGPARWATVRVDGRDWSKVLSVGRLEGRVIGCFADEHALILYVYVPHLDGGVEDNSSVITYYVQSYSA